MTPAPLDLTPDALGSVLAGDLTQEQYEALEEMWPAAFAAVNHLYDLIDDGELHEATSELDQPLFWLTWEFTGA